MGFRAFLLMLFLAFGLAAPAQLFAGVEQISEKEFRELAAELSPKVNLFAETWKQNPEAEFYGGTTRDYFYWLKGQFKDAKTKTEAKEVVRKLKASPMIDVREFIIGDSDVDIISQNDLDLDPKDFGVRKIDWQSPDLLDPQTVIGQNELLQGYIPAEKIRLNKKGIPNTELGNGIAEIYSGKLSVHFASPADFARSKYAQESVNHPVLLALRYLRVQAINYYRSHGSDFPDKKLLFAGMDASSEKAVRAVIESALKPQALDKYFKQDRFTSWFNGAIQKSFRSYTNPTAALELMEEYKVTLFPELYPKKVHPLNQYVFAQYRDPTAIAKALRDHKVDEKKFFTPAREFFPDGQLYHGTKEEAAFRGILFQGILPSEDGSAGAGLYGVAEPFKGFSEKWAGDKNRLIRFEVKSDAKIVDITEGEGQRIFEATRAIHRGDEDAFAKLFGIDVIRYPYNSAQAFVVKNASVLGRPEGVYRTLMPISKILEATAGSRSPAQIAELLSVNGLSKEERKIVWDNSQVTVGDVIAFMRRTDVPEASLEVFGVDPYWNTRPEVEKVIAEWIDRPEEKVRRAALEFFLKPNLELDSARVAALDRVFTSPAWETADKEKSDILRRLTSFGIAAPHAREYSVNETINRLERGQMFELGQLYLMNTEIPEQDLEKFLAIALKDGPSKTQLAGLLLKHGYKVNMMRSHLLEKFRETKATRYADANVKVNIMANLLRPLAIHAENDPEVVQEIKTVIQAMVKRVEADQAASFQLKNLVENLSHEERRAALRPVFASLKRDHGQKRHLLWGLHDLDLTDKELAAYIDGLPVNPQLNLELLTLPLKPVRGKIGPEAGRALLRLYNATDISTQELRHVVFASILEEAKGNEGEWQKYVAEKFKHALKTKDRADTAAAIGTLELLGSPKFPLSPPLIDESLTFLETVLRNESGRDNRFYMAFFERLPFSDPATNKRVQKLILEKSITFPGPQHVEAIVTKMPDYLSEFRDFVSGQIHRNMLEEARKFSNQGWKNVAASLPKHFYGTANIGCPAQFKEVGK